MRSEIVATRRLSGGILATRRRPARPGLVVALRSLVLGLGLHFLGVSDLRADALDEWTWRGPGEKGSFKGENYNGVAYASGVLVAVGGSGGVLMRKDGEANWHPVNSGTQ